MRLVLLLFLLIAAAQLYDEHKRVLALSDEVEDLENDRGECLFQPSPNFSRQWALHNLEHPREQ